MHTDGHLDPRGGRPTGKLIVASLVGIDGVILAFEGPEVHTSGGFVHYWPRVAEDAPHGFIARLFNTAPGGRRSGPKHRKPLTAESW